MKRNLLVLGTGIALFMFSGCAADRLKPSQALPGTNVRNPPPELNLSEVQILEHAAAQPPSPVAGEGWRPLFDGHSLTGWRIIDYGGQSRVAVRKNLLLLPSGAPFTGVNFTNDAPKVNYEISLEAMRVSGSDFFCGLTFPVRDSFCSLIVGGWGGTLVGFPVSTVRMRPRTKPRNSSASKRAAGIASGCASRKIKSKPGSSRRKS